MTYGEWTENISLFKRYLIQHKQKEVAERLNFHIKNVKQVKEKTMTDRKTDNRRATECWMTALRYDILCRQHIFIERLNKEPIKDIGTFMKKYEDKAKDKSLNFGEANGGETNPYAKGGKLEWRHPETDLALKRRGPRPNRNFSYGARPGFNQYNRGPNFSHNVPFHQNQLPTIHMGFPSQGQSNSNQAPVNVGLTSIPNVATNNNTQPNNYNNYQGRGARGTWRGTRGGVGRGVGRQVQNET
ncbi:uncharacterized protein MELLADRAFT_106258 [Melampsora larici-populina 98AG31]|uniref:Uncharacterized protein n=1 Tax=Melampsora larici-populina (strain 98AG31 / pathotype 3-4-7) TaxID=747676 RepID=F4RKT2_MELLP|nr:uncharacterized protein MELLADRAFT_106258 [Melampsora larici-populina 98AG31]EGG06985.1 hypothetical protein MELLADRAFT_106258 [Melampsora larici-populina 98AG31]